MRLCTSSILNTLTEAERDRCAVLIMFYDLIFVSVMGPISPLGFPGSRCYMNHCLLSFDHGLIFLLTYWDRVTHMCICNLTTVGSDNCLSPCRHQAIIWTHAGILLIGPLGTNFSEILIEILPFSFTKMRLMVSSTKWRPFCFGLNVLIEVIWPCIIVWRTYNDIAIHFIWLIWLYELTGHNPACYMQTFSICLSICPSVHIWRNASKSCHWTMSNKQLVDKPRNTRSCLPDKPQVWYICRLNGINGECMYWNCEMN